MPPIPGWEERITLHRAEMLGHIERGLTIARVADEMHLQPGSVRSQLREVRPVAGVARVTDLGRFWRCYRPDWLVYAARSSGVTQPELDQLIAKLQEQEWPSG
jgi:hypothetical protein